MRVLVTGSSGRLGRSLSAVLAEKGHEVIGAGRNTVGIPGVREVTCDFTDEQATADLLAAEKPDAIVHLAAIAVPFGAPEREILVTNSVLTHTVLAAAADAGVDRVLCSTSPTPVGYSSPDWRPDYLPIDEAHPLRPAHAYGLSKIVMEEAAAMFARTTDMAVGCFRPCYVIAPEEWAGAPTQQGHTVLERLEDPALAAVSLFNYVDARDVGDFVDLWLTAPKDAVTGEVFFVGADDALAHKPIAEIWREYAPHMGEGADALTEGLAAFSNDKARELIGWRPTYTWRSALAEAGVAIEEVPA